MRRATLRFYAELRDLVDSPTGEVTKTFLLPGSVKDLIESCGVPHTEVDLILVNGDSVDLAHLIDDGDQVSVYPMFEAFDVGGVSRVRPQPLRETRFVLDVHLGRLARYLRLLGFDADYSNARDDRELVEISIVERRILLTRDLELLKHGDLTHGAFLRSTDPTEQLMEIVRRFHLRSSIEAFTRCMACNTSLVEGLRDQARVPAGVRRRHSRFQSCPSCGRAYWPGSHLDRLEELISRARQA